MERLRVVIGSSDGKSVADKHMGDTERFCVFDVFEADAPDPVDTRENTALNMGHAKIEKMKAVMKIIEDADVLVARKRSPNFVRIASNTRFQPVVAKGETISDVLEELKESFQRIRELVRRRSAGETFETVLEL